jgi:hypothetical protein
VYTHNTYPILKKYNDVGRVNAYKMGEERKPVKMIAKDFPLNYLFSRYEDHTTIHFNINPLMCLLSFEMTQEGIVCRITFKAEQMNAPEDAISVEYFRDTSFLVPFVWPCELRHFNTLRRVFAKTIDGYVVLTIYDHDL